MRYVSVEVTVRVADEMSDRTVMEALAEELGDWWHTLHRDGTTVTQADRGHQRWRVEGI